ncbi:anti-sigma factor family protein [Streptomyces sp. NPDC002586]
MTSTTDTAGHPDVEEISDLTEGLLAPARSTDIRRHLETCELCADVHASLEEIRGLLGSLSEAEHMPADVARRIDAALAAEALLSASAPESPSGQISTETEPGREGSEGHVSRETSLPPETSLPSDRPAGRPQAATGPGRKGRMRGRRRRVVLGAVLTAAVLGAGSLVLQSLGNHGSDTNTAHGRPTPSVGPFSGTSVQSQVKDLLATEKKPQRGSASQRPRSGLESERNTPQSTESAKTLIQPDVTVPDCVRAALHRSDDVLGAKTGTYDGKSAYLVVVPDASDSAQVTAYIVDAACIRQQPGAAGKVLLQYSFPRT